MILPVTLNTKDKEIHTYGMLDTSAKGYAFINESFATLCIVGLE